MAPFPRPLGNKLLAALEGEDLALLQPSLEPLELKVRDVLFKPNRPIANVYFLEEDSRPSLQKMRTGGSLEVGVIGREGMVGVPVILGERRLAPECLHPRRTLVQ